MSAARQVTKAPPVNPEAIFRGLVQDLTKGELELPGFPDVVLRLQRALADEKTAVKDLLKLIQSEPSLSARLVKLANSAAFNKSGREFTDMRATLTNLGFNIIRAQAAAFAMSQMDQQEWLLPIRKQLTEIWGWSNGTAALMHALARHDSGVQPDEALAAGLFHQLGKLYLYSRALRDGVPAAQIQDWEEQINAWHPPIAKAILDDWNMPERMGEAMDNQNALFETAPHDLPPLSKLLAAAKLCYRRSRRMARGETDTEADEVLAKVTFDGKPVLTLIDQMGGEIEAMRQAMSF
jgi:HD-like signal output (HDOD) protein